MPEVALRQYGAGDFAAVKWLWHLAGLHPSQSDDLIFMEKWLA